MARTRDTIVESTDVLEKLEQQHEGTTHHARARMLRLMKERPELTFSQIRDIIGCSERSLQRWWGSYRRGGIPILMRADAPPRGKPRRIDEQNLQALQRKLELEGFTGLNDVQSWLQEQCGISYSRSGVWNLLRNSAKATPRGWHLISGDDLTTPAQRSGGPQSTGVSNQVLHFLNSLPTSSDAREWGLQFRESLRGLLGDVDRISINVNRDCRLDNTTSVSSSITIRQSISEEDPQDSSVLIVRDTASPSEALMEGIRNQGFPVGQFQEPLMFDYYYGKGAYLGTVILWREVSKTAISDSSRHLMSALQPFMIFALSDLVARHQADRPIDRVFHDALANLVDEAHLSPQEERIVILQLMGHSYKEMADLLTVTVDTVKKHFKQIHRKTATRGQAELFAKYFTSRLIPDSFRDLDRDTR